MTLSGNPGRRTSPLVVLAVLALVTLVLPRFVVADVVLLDARCVDPGTGSIQPASVWIEGDVIRALGSPDGSDLGPGASDVPRLDLGGAHLLPGLVDLRVYGTVQRSPGHRDSLSADGARRLALASGVVAALDVFSVSDATGPEGAAWIGGAPLLVARGAPEASFPSARPLDSPAMAINFLETGRLADDRPLQVVFDGRYALALGPETLGALLDGAGRRPVAVQVRDWVDVRTALDHGVRWLVQIPDGPMPEDVRERIAGLGSELAWTPQVALGLDFAAWAQADSLRDDPGLARVLPDTMRDDYARVRIPQTRYGEVEQRKRILQAVMSLLQQSDTRLLAGSGAGAIGTALGFSLARELEWWVELGIDPWRGLRAATVDAAAMIGRDCGWDVGAPADLVVVEVSPIESMATLRAPTRVIRGGEVVDPVALAATVVHRPFEDLPENPIPGGGRVPMVVLLVIGFAVLLFLRRWVRRAAARALAEDSATD